MFVAFGSADIGLQRDDQLPEKTPVIAARDFRQPVVKIVGVVLECDACHGVVRIAGSTHSAKVRFSARRDTLTVLPPERDWTGRVLFSESFRESAT